MTFPTRLGKRNALFQQWESLLHNRQKRTRAGEMLVQGVRPIDQAMKHHHDYRVRALLVDERRRLSRWADQRVTEFRGPVVTVASDLMAELGERDDGPPELLAVVATPPDDLDRIPKRPDAGPVVVLDRLGSPGNVGTICRSADALGASGVILTGHSADPWDPASIRASTGSIFALPVIRQAAPDVVIEWLNRRSGDGAPTAVIGLDEAGEVDLDQADLSGALALVIGQESSGLSQGWKEHCDRLVSIPMGGSASSLNAANAASIALYEAARQRR